MKSPSKGNVFVKCLLFLAVLTASPSDPSASDQIASPIQIQHNIDTENDATCHLWYLFSYFRVCIDDEDLTCPKKKKKWLFQGKLQLQIW